MVRWPSVIFGDGGQSESGNDIYQLRAVLRGISQLVWRRLLVRADSSVADLHEVLQIAFGWEAAESVFADLMTCLSPVEGIRHTLLPFHTTRKSATRPAHPNGKTTGLPSCTAMTPVSRGGSYGSSLMFTRPLSLVPHPLVAGRIRNISSQISFRCVCRGTLLGRFRRFLAEAAISHRHLIAEHQVGTSSRRVDSHQRGFAPLKNTSLATLVAPRPRPYPTERALGTKQKPISFTTH